MPEIYQRFDLDLKAIGELDYREFIKLNLPGAAKTMMDELTENYVVLESSTDYNGIPHSIIIGGKLSNHFEKDFYGLIEKFGLPYRTGIHYTPK